MNYNLSFIKEEDFREHVNNTINEYIAEYEKLNGNYSIDDFLKNSVDGIKLMFDQAILNKSDIEIIKDEIIRKQSKTVNNAIGYFNQNIFKYIANCYVPKNGEIEGFDIIYTDPETEQKYFIELKNKHNTLNSGGIDSLLNRFNEHLLNNPNDICIYSYIVPSYSKRGDNRSIETIWTAKGNTDSRIKHMTIDNLLYLITKENDAFMKIYDELNVMLKEYNFENIKSNCLENIAKKVYEDILKKGQADNLVDAIRKISYNGYRGI